MSLCAQEVSAPPTVSGISNLGRPLAVIVAIEQNQTPPNSAIAQNLYSIVRNINEGRSDPPKDIKLALVGRASSLSQVERELRKFLTLSPSENIPYVQTVEVKSAPYTWFLQDVGEIVNKNGPGGGKDLGFLVSGLSKETADALSQIFNLSPFSIFPVRPELTQGVLGGNIESTPQGQFYVGDTLTPTEVSLFQKFTNQNVLVVPARFLAVGHVDELFSFIPSLRPCGYALAYASPIEALNLLIQDPNSEPFIRSLLYNPRIPFLSGEEITRKELLESVSFLSNAPEGTLSATNLKLSDFDPSKKPRTPLDEVMMANILASIEITKGIQILNNSSACPFETIPLPVLFRQLHFSASSHRGRLVSFFPNSVNHVVLGNHLVVPSTRYNVFDTKVTERLATHLGAVSQVHFIDSSIWNRELGEVHCATQVIRNNFGAELPVKD